MFLQGLNQKQLVQRLNKFEDEYKNSKIYFVKQICDIKFTKSQENCLKCTKSLKSHKLTGQLPCSHNFHIDCLYDMIQNGQIKCLQCSKVHGMSKLKQWMTKQIDENIGIIFEVEDCVVERKKYKGLKIKVVLPNNKEGKLIEQKLEKAFNLQILFKIGLDLETGQEMIIPIVTMKDNVKEVQLKDSELQEMIQQLKNIK